ncbi:MAG TPA: nucleotidyltransferase family protein [Burkholderiaceae bacterium]|nr:nucleotidyltransferase family protein [Burkholderiaceae bacterium]
MPPPPPAALLLAAGRGERMRPLTDTCPKPLLSVRGQPLLMWHVQALLGSGVRRLVVNTAWLAPKISSFFEPYRFQEKRHKLQNSEQSPVFDLHLSDEQADFGGALETAGGIGRALPMLCPSTPDAPHGSPPDDVFWVVAGDVFVPGFAFSPEAVARFRASPALAHLWLVPNPAHNPRGDFGLAPDGRALNLPASDTTTPRHTYSTIGLYRAGLFAQPWCDIPAGNPQGVHAALAPLLRRAMDAGRVTAELYTGPWTDVGTPERLAQLNAAG